MIIKHVNGIPRQVFVLGEEPSAFEYYAPMKLGAGYRKELENAKLRLAIGSDAYALIMEKTVQEKTKPRGLPDDAWQRELAESVGPEILKAVQAINPGEIDAKVLEILLTPADGSPDVRTAYMEYATEAQVQAVVNFSMGLAENKTEDESKPQNSGKRTSKSRGAR